MRISSRTVIDYLYIIIGSAVTAYAVAVFLNPAKLAPGGVSGIATILYHLFGWDLGTVIFALTVPVFLIGLKLFGKQRWFRSLWKKFLDRKVARLNARGFEDSPYKDL